MENVAALWQAKLLKNVEEVSLRLAAACFNLAGVTAMPKTSVESPSTFAPGKGRMASPCQHTAQKCSKAKVMRSHA